MNNKTAEKLIEECNKEIAQIEKIIETLSIYSEINPYLTKYTIIKSCGTIEQSFKTIIAEYCQAEQSKFVQNYIEITFKNNSMNPTYENIHRSLKNFDDAWNSDFKARIKNDTRSEKLISSLNSLNKVRHAFAHGENLSTTFKDIKLYFQDSCKIISILDHVVHDSPKYDL